MKFFRFLFFRRAEKNRRKNSTTKIQRLRRFSVLFRRKIIEKVFVSTKTKKIHPDFAKLIVYSKIVSLCDLEKDSSLSISLTESKLEDFIEKRPRQIVDLTRNHLVRVYPSAKRQDSSNYNPMVFWTRGSSAN